LRAELGELEFKCDKYCAGFKYDEHRNHPKTCQSTIINCPNVDCDAKLSRRNLEHHLQHECEHVWMKCSRCGKADAWFYLKDHNCPEILREVAKYKAKDFEDFHA
jgi:hypothetical protein